MKQAITEYGKFYYFAPDMIGQSIASGAFFDAHYKPYLDRLKPGNVFVDVGANIGFLSIYAAKKGAYVIAFEASPQVTEVLKANVVENNLVPKVMICNYALYDSEIELGVNPEWQDWVPAKFGGIDYERSPNSGGLSLVPGKGWQARTLDSFNLVAVDMLKVDTQGADLRVLVGAKHTIVIHRPTVLFEFEDGGRGRNASGDTLQDFFDFFKDVCYTVTQVHTGMHGRDYVAEPV